MEADDNSKVSYFEIPTPESCGGKNPCQIRYSCQVYYKNYRKNPASNNPIDKVRHKDCPLKLQRYAESTTIDGVKTRLVIPEDKILENENQGGGER